MRDKRVMSTRGRNAFSAFHIIVGVVMIGPIATCFALVPSALGGNEVTGTSFGAAAGRRGMLSLVVRPMTKVSDDVTQSDWNNSKLNIPSSTARRGFLSRAAAFALGGTVTMLPGTARAEFKIPEFKMPKGVGGGSGKGAGGGMMEGTAWRGGRLGGLANKIRSVGRVMDELQRDLMQERWDLVETYPAQLRSYVPVFTTYTDSAFPTDAPTDKGLRVALRYEVGRFFASLERLRQATSRRALNEAYVAYSDMSLHFDRYLHVGGLYTYYDAMISTEPYFKGISEDALVYSDPFKDPAEVRDLVVLVKGPDKGKTGIVIGIYPDGSNTCAVKLDKYKGMREIKVVPRAWAAKRLGEQDPDDVFLIPRREKA